MTCSCIDWFSIVATFLVCFGTYLWGHRTGYYDGIAEMKRCVRESNKEPT